MPSLCHVQAIFNLEPDIVYPESKRCCCFTKSYYRYVKGTGSLLATSEVGQFPNISSLFSPSFSETSVIVIVPAKFFYFTSQKSKLKPEENPEISSGKEMFLRFFTPREVSTLQIFTCFWLNF